jgi:hypothetical protein
MRTVPVKYSAGPLQDGCEPLLLIFMFSVSSIDRGEPGYVILFEYFEQRFAIGHETMREQVR